MLHHSAKLYGIFSAKWLYIGSIVLFEAGSALCGAAPSMNVMIVGRAIAGLGVSKWICSIDPVTKYPRDLVCI